MFFCKVGGGAFRSDARSLAPPRCPGRARVSVLGFFDHSKKVYGPITVRPAASLRFHWAAFLSKARVLITYLLAV